MSDVKPLDGGQRHIMRLVARDADSEGWAVVSKKLLPVLRKSMPPQLFEIEDTEDGKGRARLTDEGASVLNAMQWLEVKS